MFANANVLPASGFDVVRKIVSKGSSNVDLPQPPRPMQATFTPRFAPKCQSLDDCPGKGVERNAVVVEDESSTASPKPSTETWKITRSLAHPLDQCPLRFESSLWGLEDVPRIVQQLFQLMALPGAELGQCRIALLGFFGDEALQL